MVRENADMTFIYFSIKWIIANVALSDLDLHIQSLRLNISCYYLLQKTAQTANITVSTRPAPAVLFYFDERCSAFADGNK